MSVVVVRGATDYKTLTFTHQLLSYPPSTHLKDDTTNLSSASTSYTHTVSGADYGNGNYIIISSSVDIYAFNSVDKIFADKTDTDNLNRFSFANDNYHNSNDNETDSYSLGGYDGDWIKVQFPEAKILQKMRIYISSDLNDRGPGVFKIFGSNDGSSWTEVYYQSTHIATLGKVHPQLDKHFGLSALPWVFTIYLDNLPQARQHNKITAVNIYPSIARDLSLLVDQDFTYASLLEHINSVSSNLLQDIQLFDVYTGNEIAANKKSLAIKLIWQHTQRTLTDVEVNAEIDNIIASLNTKLGITVRQ